MKKIGITTTVPMEVLLAAGYTPVDLNNIFITDVNHKKYIEIAEREGFPKSTCAWIKGIYGVCLDQGIEEVLGVIGGDCSNTKALVDVLNLRGIKIYPFGFPHDHSLEELKKEIDKLMNIFGVSITEVEKVRKQVNRIRELGIRLDELTYLDFKAKGFENHLFQVSFSDLWCDQELFEKTLGEKIAEIEKRPREEKALRIGYIGVPPMTSDIYDFAENNDAKIIYNEVQREFAFPRGKKAKNIYEQYYDYTYVYDVDFRIEELKRQIELRKLDGIIHYTQAFCYRAIEDIVLKEKLDVPILNIEGDTNNLLDERTKLRIEAFLDMLKDLRRDSDEDCRN